MWGIKRCRALEGKLDESVAFAMELLAQEPGANRDEQTRDVKAKLEGDLTSLRKQLRESQVLSDEYGERLGGPEKLSGKAPG